MPLNPQVEKIIYGAQRSATPAFPALGAKLARIAYEKAIVSVDIAPVPMYQVSDLAVELAGRTLTVRQYASREHSWAEPMPALLFFHGGGFTIGSVDTHDRLCRMLAHGADCLVYSLDYRLAPEHRFPAAADDAFDTLGWLDREALSLGVDPARIAVGGDSAGGTLAAACALHARDIGMPLVLQMLIYPGLSAWQDTDSHKRLTHGYLLDAEVIQWFFSQYLRSDADRDDWRFAPLMAPSLARVAPAWIALAEYDPLVDEGLAYAQRLRSAGVPATSIVYEGMIHSFFQHGGLVPKAREAHAQACLALRAAYRQAQS
ncbi:MAG: alpha/beta hydrolase [Quisquiliibacterium sp.]